MNVYLPRKPIHRSKRLVFLILLVSLPVLARQGAPPFSLQGKVQPLANIAQLVLPSTDIQAELAADAKRTVPTPLRFAVVQEVEVTPATHGTWEQLPDGRLWRLRIASAGATDLNLGFTTFWLPEGATLHIIAESEQYYQGPYTAQDNKPHGQLWTPVVPGEEAVIELFVPAQAKKEPRLVLSQVGTGYRDFFHKQKDLDTPKAEGTCNNDVVCPVAAAWTNEIRSVGVYTVSGYWTCSGTLIADAAGDFRNYFLTANHCDLNSGNAPSVVVYWNYQSATCGTHGPGSLAQNQSGAIFRAAKYDVDFALIELDDIPDCSFGVYYSGWDRSGTAPAGGVGIHHPDCDVKAISFSSNALTTVNSCIGTGGSSTHWEVIWSSGVTEPGSSGSGIWDPATHRLVGTLSGGGSACSTPYDPDCYGKFSVAWASGSSSADRLRDWLDPQNTGVTSVAGVDPMLTSVIAPTNASLVSENCSPTNGVIDPNETVTVSFTLKNWGGRDTTNLVATLLSTNGVVLPSAAQNYGALTCPGSSVSRSFTFTANGTCGGTITPTLQLQDGPVNLGTASFGFQLGKFVPVTTMTQNFDTVTAPALPAGWTTSASGAQSVWVTSTAVKDTAPNAAFSPDPGSIGVNELVSSNIAIGSSLAQLTFKNNYNLESGFDGGVLEIKIGSGSFTDILSAGGSFVSGGYNHTISTSYSNPLGGRLAWSGNSGGFITTVVNLPAAATGQNIQLKWRCGSDSSVSGTGWYIDTLSVADGNFVCCQSTVNTTPTNITTVVSGGSNLVLSWPVDHIGWRLQAQTQALNRGIQLHATNWFFVTGSATTNAVTVPLVKTNPSVFYRLYYP